MKMSKWMVQFLERLKPEDQYATLFEWCDIHGKVSHFAPEDDGGLHCAECGQRTRELPEVPDGSILIWGEKDLG